MNRTVETPRPFEDPLGDFPHLDGCRVAHHGLRAGSGIHSGPNLARIVEGGLLTIERSSDATWMILAALIALWLTLQSYGSKALIPAGIIALGAALAEGIGATTGFPFGDYRYSDAFGLRIGGILPFTIPLAWYAVVTGALGGARLLIPKTPPIGQALVAATLATLTDFNLEEVTWKIRGYWEWYPDHPEDLPPPSLPPAANFASWFILSFIFCRLLIHWEKENPDQKTDWNASRFFFP